MRLFLIVFIAFIGFALSACAPTIYLSPTLHVFSDNSSTHKDCR